MSWKTAPDLPQGHTGGSSVRRPWSLAARLTAWYAGSAFALILAATGFLYWALVTSLDREDDEFLADEVRVLRMLLRDRPGDANALKQEIEWESAARHHVRVYVRILAEGGAPIVETPGMSEALPREAFADPAALNADLDRGADFRTPGGKFFRILADRATAGPAGDSTRIIQVALDRSQELDLLINYRRNLWLVLGLALVACAVAGYQIARRGIRPVEEVTETAHRIRSTTLDERLQTAGLPAELLALAGTFNEMLDRLEESFARLSRFSADIAHELRTPLHNLRGEAEVALSRARLPEEYRDVLGSSLEECNRLSRMIDSLLFLARAENPQTHIQRDKVHIDRELATVLEFYAPAASEAGVALDVDAPGGIQVDLDRSLFQRAVGNLVENALTHTPKGGYINLSAKEQDGMLRVEVSDTGCGIPPADLPHVFDRFYRVDHARATATGGVGLGLAIVKSIAELHGGSIEISSEVGVGSRVTLFIPKARE